MATTKKYVSLEKLGLYDEKIKKFLADADAAALAEAKAHADGLADNYEAAGAVATAQEALQKNIDEVSAANVATQTEVDALETLVGVLPEGTTAKDVVGYVNLKTSGIATDAALGELNNQVSGLQTAVQNIQKDYLTSEDETALNDAITAEANRAKGIEGGLETRLKAVEDDHLVGTDKTELQGNIDGVSSKVTTLIGEDANKSVRTIANEELAKQLIAEGAQESLDTLAEIAAWIQEHPGDAAAMNAAIEALQKKVDTGDKTVSAYVTDAITALSIGDYAKAADLTELADKVSALEAKFGEGEGSVDGMISAAMDAEKARVDGLLDKKVDKIEGKGLSTNDLTDELKGQYDDAYAHSQVAHAPADAQANVIENVKVNGAALTITDKAVDIAVPVDNAELTNGAGYLVAGDIANKADKATTLEGYGIADAYTSAQTDAAIANAMAEFEECTQADIEGLFA